MPYSHPQPEQKLDGYTLRERIGAGGYGEVWSAEAPGGLLKAIKYVYGSSDEKRAGSELKALSKVRDVRHPFVLSLERFEVVDGRLLIVTELADGSLRDRYRDCLEQGRPGIPREELLGCLRDAADALDYLFEEHGLQHLDVKPENLLLVAGRVKVADFGLVKSLNDATQSVVGGLTPTYAAPEVFQGGPSRHSDQYSLAVMYQELLTGTLPFSGQNTAELTLQHLNDDPNLSPLEESDRFVLSRALAKDPMHRFDSCRAMVNALLSCAPDASAEPVAVAARRPSRGRPSAPVAGPVTEVFDDPFAPAAASAPAPKLILDPPPAFEVVEAPTADPSGAFAPAPALFIGVGGAAGIVLRGVRKRLTQRYGQETPALRFLLMDTDPRGLVAAGRNAGKGEGLLPVETIALPLKRPQEYRDKASRLLGWLGRRWLYNISKSLRTEGIRPLGRLALIDHARQAFQRVRVAVADCISPEAREATAEAVGLPFRDDALRVYVVACVSGGTGSGMVTDVAYAARAIAQRLGAPHTRLMGVLLHATGRDAERNELARVSTLAWLNEHNYFLQGAAYPGDEGSGLPAHEGDTPPFDHTYLVSLGERLDAQALEAEAELVSEYLLQDALSPAQRTLDAWREATEPAGRPLRTFAVRQPHAAPGGVAPATLTLGQLLASWCADDVGRESDSEAEKCASTNRIVHGAVQLVGRLRIDSPSLTSSCRALLDAFKTGQTDVVGAQPDPWGRLLVTPAGRLGGPTTLCGEPIDAVIEPLALKLATEIERWVVARVDCPAERLPGALQAVSWLRDHLASVRRDIARVAGAILAPAGKPRPWQKLPDAESAELASLEATASIVETVQRALERLATQIASGRQELRAAVAGLMPRPDQSAEGPAAAKECLRTLEGALQAGWIAPRGGLLSVLNSAELRRELLEVARGIAGEVQSARVAESAADLITPPALLAASGGAGFRLACGADAKALEPAAPLETFEATLASARHVAAWVVEGRADLVAYAGRLWSRQDVPWTEVLAGPDEQPGEASASTPAPEAQRTINLVTTPLPEQAAPV